MTRKSSSYASMGIVSLIAVMLGTSVCAQESHGIRFNNLTISPYVNLEANFDSNVDIDTQGYDDWYLTINPGVDLTYTGNDWGLSGNLWYSYDKYQQYDVLDEPRYGEKLTGHWASPKGLSLVVGQSYMKSKSNDSILDGGRGIWRERDYLDFQGALSYQIGERMGLTLSGQYSDLNYKNDSNKYGKLYGWEEWSVGLQLARKLTEKSNFLVSGTYQEYESEGAQGNGFKRGSEGYSLMAGVGSRATERINYRLMTGANWFDYGNQGNTVGWTYSIDVNWLINNKWSATVVGSSYFQPSETEANQSMQVYTISSGVTYRPFQKLSLHGDIAYRQENDEYGRTGYGVKMEDDIWSARFRANYQLQQYVSVYAGIEYTDWQSDRKEFEYDRFLGTVGVKLRY